VKKGDIETVFRDGVWINWSVGVGLVSRHSDKQSAIKRGRLLARLRNSTHWVRDEGEPAAEGDGSPRELEDAGD
jgi:hypothetical protein